MNKFTLIIHNKGWSVGDACAHWNIHYDTYNARCNNPKMFNQLECMCNGLKDKGNAYMTKEEYIKHVNANIPVDFFKKDKLNHYDEITLTR